MVAVWHKIVDIYAVTCTAGAPSPSVAVPAQCRDACYCGQARGMPSRLEVRTGGHVWGESAGRRRHDEVLALVLEQIEVQTLPGLVESKSELATLGDGKNGRRATRVMPRFVRDVAPPRVESLGR